MMSTFFSGVMCGEDPREGIQRLIQCGATVLAVFVSSASMAGPIEQPGEFESAAIVSTPLTAVSGVGMGGDGLVRLELNQPRLNSMLNKSSVSLTDFVLAPLVAGGPPVAVTLDLEPVEVFGPETRFVLA